MIMLVQFIQLTLVLASAGAHRVVESAEDASPVDPIAVTPLANTTTLYAVNTTDTTTPAKASPTTKLKSATSWKIETTFGESKLEQNGTTDSKEEHSREVAVERPANSSLEFKPSPHLGAFIDEDSLHVVPTRETTEAFTPVIKKPPTGFISSTKGHFKSSINKIPKDIFKNYHQFPYKFEPAILTKAKDGWKPSGPSVGATGSGDSGGGSGGQEPRPTDEAPVSVPAGGLYKLPDPFKEKPGFGDDDFGLEFSNDGKEHGLKKPRSNPWKNLLHFLTALIPVGIIFSALTPNVITIEPEQQPISPNIFRRGDGSFVQIPSISEKCRRRLLCELHSETNYSQNSVGRRGKLCHRLRCEDPQSLARTLHYLLAFHTPPGRGEDHFT